MLKKAWEWFKDKMVTLLAYIIIYSMVFGYAVWLAVLWCWHKLAACFHRKQAGGVSVPMMPAALPAPAIPSSPPVLAPAPVIPVPPAGGPAPVVSAAPSGTETATSPPWSEQLMVGIVCLASITVYIVSGWSAWWVGAVGAALALLYAVRKPATREWLKIICWKKILHVIAAVLGTVGALVFFYQFSGAIVPTNPIWKFIAISFIVLWLAASLKLVPSDTYLFVAFWGKRWRVVGEGLHFLPFGFEWTAGGFKYKKEQTDGIFTVITKEEGDKGHLELEVKFSLLWLPDPENAFTFFRMEAAAIHNEIQDAVKEVILAVAGNRPATDFIESVEYIQLLVECHLALPREKVPCGASLAEALDYCRGHKDEIQRLLADRKNRSEFETKIGIIADMFSLVDTDLSPPVKLAMEATRKAEEELKAVKINAEAQNTALEIRERGKRELREALTQDNKMSTAEAVEAGEVAYGQSSRTIHSFRGLGDLVPLAQVIIDGFKK